MSDMSTSGFGLPVAAERDRALSIFGQVMGLVAVTCGFAAVGAYVGKDISGLAWLIPWVGAIACIIGLNVANSKGKRQLALTLLFALGLLLGISIGNTIHYYAETQPTALYQAAGATALFVGILGTGGFAIRRDLSGLYRFAFWALLGLLVFGLVVVLFQIDGAYLIYSILGLAVFGLYTVIDFNRLRRAGQGEVIPLAAGIFLDVFNIFLFFLQIFGGRN
jgi:modulator of FtsH protease